MASPEATAVVGIRWEMLKGSVFDAPVQAELSGTLGFPDLAALRQARQILISSPATLAILSGNFPEKALRADALAKGLKPASYRGVELWISPGKTLSAAWLNEQLMLVGLRRTLEGAIDRSQAAEQGTSRHYTPLLASGARLAPDKDLWVVSTRLPDPLASVFVPLDTEAHGFAGGVSFSGGIHMDALLEAGSEEGAARIAEKLRAGVSELPEIGRGLKAVAEADHVLLTLEVSREQLLAGMRGAEPAPAAADPVAQAVAPAVAPVAALAASPVPAPKVAARAVVPPQPAPAVDPLPSAGPRVIRILGLDDGPREILLPPLKPEHP